MPIGKVLILITSDPLHFCLALKSGDIGRPFNHYCGRGQKASDETSASHVCINAHHHGAFSSRADNEDRKKCTYSAQCLCIHNPKCIWTHPDGRLKPCRNDPSSVPVCTHNPKCY